MSRSSAYSCIKRLFDILSSALALLVLSPVWVFAAVGIVVSDPGPVLYRAHRAGKNNLPFIMYKFRSMRVDRSADERSLRPDTGRIFPFGAFLRSSKIDELPQLLNVLLGDMAVIGPRPASMDQVDITRSGENAIVASLQPGLSGPSALYDYIYGDLFEDEAEYTEKVLPTRLALDRWYVEHRSLRLDAKMIVYTVCCILGSVLHRGSDAILRELLSYVIPERAHICD